MSGTEPRYLSYLLRLWQVRSGGQLVWRASLESPQTGERTGFLSLEALLAFLERQIVALTDSENGGAGTPRRRKEEGGTDTSPAP